MVVIASGRKENWFHCWTGQYILLYSMSREGKLGILPQPKHQCPGMTYVIAPQWLQHINITPGLQWCCLPYILQAMLLIYDLTQSPKAVMWKKKKKARFFSLRLSPALWNHILFLHLVKAGNMLLQWRERLPNAEGKYICQHDLFPACQGTARRHPEIGHSGTSLVSRVAWCPYIFYDIRWHCQLLITCLLEWLSPLYCSAISVCSGDPCALSNE